MDATLPVKFSLSVWPESTLDLLPDSYHKFVFHSQSVEPIFIEGVTRSQITEPIFVGGVTCTLQSFVVVMSNLYLV